MDIFYMNADWKQTHLKDKAIRRKTEKSGNGH